MKNKYVLLSLIYFLFLLPSNIEAQIWSAETVYFPASSSISTLKNSATRFGYHANDRSTYYMRYDDTSYFCSGLNVAMWISTPTSYKIPMPQNFVITSFEKFRNCQGFVGSYQGVGMYGRALSYNFTLYPNEIQVFKLPTVNILHRIAAGVSSSGYGLGLTKVLATADKTEPSRSSRISNILEFYAEGTANGPYLFAPLAYDPVTGEQEIADDVIMQDGYAIFATRDSRHNHAYVNLRIADTHNVLLSTEIDSQWRFLLQPNENVLGEIRLRPLDKDFFVMAYVVHDIVSDAFFLNIHKIILSDFLLGNNTIETHVIKLERSVSTLVDIIYEPVVKTMVVLLNGEDRSVLYHVDPYFSTGTFAYKLDYSNGNLYSLDTIRDDVYTSPIAMYVAAGGGRFFSQDISNGVVPIASCLTYTKIETPEMTPPSFVEVADPIDCFTNNKSFVLLGEKAILFDGIKPCFLPQNESDIDDIINNKWNNNN